ncbi:MAG: hypothetical protein HOV94_03500 [Saccharothrix sp.]|nr:hypothetical protein [Saccharothrix sp.]
MEQPLTLRRRVMASHHRAIELGGEAYVDLIDVCLDDFADCRLSRLREVLAEKPERGIRFRPHFEAGWRSEDVWLEVDPNGDLVHLGGVSDAVGGRRSDAARTLSAIYTAISATVSDVEFVSDHDMPLLLCYTVTFNDLDVTLGELHRCVIEADGWLGVPEDDGVPMTIGELRRHLDNRNAAALIGVPESESLDCKMAVDLDTEAGKVELAQDVARFANSEHAALLVVGARTKKVDGVDTVAKLTPVPREGNRPQRYSDVIDARVYPPVRGLSVRLVDTGDDRCLVVVDIPAQREADKPFLVHGALVGGKVEGAFFSIVRRRGEASVPVTAREVHAMMAAGRHALRGRSTAD